MSVNFYDDTWKHVEAELKKAIENATSVCINGDKTYKELLRAQGAIAALRTILKMPEQISVPATPRK